MCILLFAPVHTYTVGLDMCPAISDTANLIEILFFGLYI